MKSISEFLSISDLLTTGRPLSQVIFKSDIRDKTWANFVNSVTSLSGRLQEYEEDRWALYCDHPFAFSVGLLALLHTGKIIVLLPNLQGGTVGELRSQFHGIISDIEHSGTEIPCLIPEDLAVPKPGGYKRLDNRKKQIEFFTSGSTGKRKVIKKALVQLESEITVLESMWGNKLKSGTIFSTVSHQHIYGLLFRILWPLSSGRPIWDEAVFNPEALLRCLEGHNNPVVISSPSYLERLPEFVDLSQLKRKPCTFFSSGGPLGVRTAERLKKTLGEAPLEVFGSTETGGIGWRRQNRLDKAAEWTPLEHVEVKTSLNDSTLMVRSPFINSKKNQWYEVGDSVVLRYSGRFVLEGRKDRLFKIGEKRLSLDEMESRLIHHPMVKGCAVISLLMDELKKRPVLGAIIVPSKEGLLSLYNNRRRLFTKTLEKELLQFFEPIMIPKRWRYVDKLPLDAQGKRKRNQLEQLFERTYNPNATELFILVETRNEHAVKLGVMIPENLIYFDGHFPSTPIVPGIVQINWVMTYAKKYFDIPSSIKRMEAVKFHHLLLPGDILGMELQWKPKTRKLFYTFSSEEKNFSSGRVVFE